METRTYNVYDWDELPEEGKKKSLENYREINIEGGFWENPDSVYEIKKWLEKNGYNDVDLRYSGFWSQGDGASFTASVDIAKWITAGKLKKKYPLTFKHSDEINVQIKQAGNYYHEMTMSIEIEAHDGECDAELVELEDVILSEAREKAKKIYKALENEYNKQTSDEAVIEMLRVNDYKFTIDGKIN